MSLKLKIVSPEKVVFDGDVESVTVPGTLGEFQILKDHAPLISLLDDGKLVYVNKDGEHVMNISGGFVEVQKNTVSVCAEFY